MGGDFAHLGAADGQRPGLVEEHGADLAEGLDRARPLDHDAGGGGAREAGDEGDRRRQDQRAGGGDDDHGEGAHRVAGERPGEAGEQQGRRQEDAGVAVGEADERRPLGLGLLDQADQGGVGALGRRAVGADLERGAGVGGAAEDRHPAPGGDRQRLAGEGAGVDHRLLAQHGAVDRDQLAAADQGDVADGHLLDRDVAEAALRGADAGALRRPLDQRRQLAAGAGAGEFLERQAAGEHQPDDDAGQQFVQRQGAEHRHQGDRVDAHVAVDDDGPDDFDRQLQGQQRQHHAPDRVAGVGLAGQVQGAADDDRRQRQRRQDPRPMPQQPGASAHPFLVHPPHNAARSATPHP